MAFFDKLNDIAKNIGDKTTDAIETTKLNSRISGERTAINELMLQIGEYYYKKYISEGAIDADVSQIMTGIDQHNAAIKELEIQLEAIRTQASVASSSVTNEDEIICPACGKQNTVGNKFCQDCGNKLVQPQPKSCPSCGAVVADGLKFCGKCGSRIE